MCSLATRAAPQHISPTAARVAVALTFFINGAAFANWVPRIPAVQQHLGLSTAALGLALLGAAVGALLAMPVTGALIARFGSQRVTRVATLVFCAALPLPALAPSGLALWAALAALGAGSGAMDVAMNAQGVAVERLIGRPIMAGFHGLYSAGGLAGAVAGGAVAAAGIAVLPHLVGAALALALLFLAAARWLLPAADHATADGPHLTLPRGRLLWLGAIAFCVLLGEGAMADWSAVYLRGSLQTSAGIAAAGFAAFSLAMAAGRMGADWVTQRLGPVAVVRLGGTIAAVGLGASLLLATPWAAVLGFASVGLGFSGIVPLVLSAAGRAHELPPGPAIAAVATMGYLGFLIGPPLIGLVAEVVTLRGALGLVALLGALAGLLAYRLRPSQQPRV